MEFKLGGNRLSMRLEEELEEIDKKEAEFAFKKYKKEILDSFLKEKAFLKWRTSSYVRLNAIGNLEYIDLQKEAYGSKTFTVNIAIMPLYFPLDHIVFSFGYRLGELICSQDVWWDFANKEIAKISFENVAQAIEAFALAWFDLYSKEEGYKKKLQENQNKAPFPEWLSALEEEKKGEVIMENINALKLPKRIMKR